jgi:putative flippase GtrA
MHANIKYTQPSAAPTAKVSAVGIGGSVTAVLFWILGQFWSVEIPPEIAAAITTIISFLSGYLVRDIKPAVAAAIIVEEGSTH